MVLWCGVCPKVNYYFRSFGSVELPIILGAPDNCSIYLCMVVCFMFIGDKALNDFGVFSNPLAWCPCCIDGITPLK